MAQAKTVALFTARPGLADELAGLLRATMVPSRAEPANLRWDIWRSPTEPDRFVVDELYVDQDGVAAHRASAHYRAYAARIDALAERVAVTVAPVEVDPVLSG